MSENRELAKKSENMVDKRQDVPTVAPMVDIYENEDNILVKADMPGVQKENVAVNIDNGKLELSGIRTVKSKGAASWTEFGDVEYRRVFSVPQTIDVGKVTAELIDGTLQLTLPKAEAAKPRTIEIR